MRIVHIILAFMFLAFAALQINDPDPFLWILIYGAMVVICVMAFFEVYNKRVMIILALCYIVYCVILLPGVTEWLAQENKSVLFDDVLKMEFPYIEESREFLGLLICLLVLAFYLVRSMRRKAV